MKSLGNSLKHLVPMTIERSPPSKTRLSCHCRRKRNCVGSSFCKAATKPQVQSLCITPLSNIRSLLVSSHVQYSRGGLVGPPTPTSFKRVPTTCTDSSLEGQKCPLANRQCPSIAMNKQPLAATRNSCN